MTIFCISNNLLFLPALKKLLRDFPDNFSFLMHSETSGDILKKTWLNHLSQDDIILPIFSGIRGIYILDSLFTSGDLDDFLLIHVNNLLINYLPPKSGMLIEEFSIKTLFDKYSPESPVYLYLSLENQLPLMLHENYPLLNTINKLTISRYELLYTIINDIFFNRTIQKEKIILSELPDSSDLKKIIRAISKKYYWWKLFPGIKYSFKPSQKPEELRLRAISEFLSDIILNKQKNCYLINNIRKTNKEIFINN